MVIKLRHWFIRKIAGDLPILANCGFEHDILRVRIKRLGILIVNNKFRNEVKILRGG